MLHLEKYLYNVGMNGEETRRNMTFWMIMTGLFMLILLEKPFKKRSSGLLFLISYLLLIAVYVIQTTFVELVSDGFLMMLAVVVVFPLFVRLVSSLRNRVHKKRDARSDISFSAVNQVRFMIL